MHSPFLTALSLRALLLSIALILTGSVVASPTREHHEGQNIKIVARQAPAPVPAAGFLSTAQACQQYSKIANFSAIGSNSTIRSAFLEASPVGTLFNSAMLNLMQTHAVTLSKDEQLNQACGNLTTIALEQVNVNFTMGIVGQYKFTENPVSIITGPIIAGIVAACVIIIVGPASAM